MIDRDVYETARLLLADHGAGALAEAVERAGRSLMRDNPFDYARWRGVGRAILMIADPCLQGSLH